MADKNKLTDYDAVAANNDNVGGVNTSETMNPSDVNDAFRVVMSHLKDFATATESVTAITATGTITANSFSGDGASVTNVDAATLDGIDSTGFDTAGTAVALAIALG